MYSLWDSLPIKLRATPRIAPGPGSKFDGEAGLPHSEICGSKIAHISPQLIAACHVLHRLCMPRHPPNALTLRLRVHTTNDNATVRQPPESSSAPQRCVGRADQISARSSRHAPSRTHAGYTASILKPIHNVKEIGPYAHTQGLHLGISGLRPGALVEPVGIEPTTSSLQS
jgi:hypothetical protein